MTVWQVIINFLNDNVGQIVTRQDLLIHVHEKFMFSGVFSNLLHNPSDSTIDTYKNYLIQAGFLQKVYSEYGRYLRGKIFVPREIPVDITIDYVRHRAYSKDDENVIWNDVTWRLYSSSSNIDCSLDKKYSTAIKDDVEDDFIKKEEMQI